MADSDYAVDESGLLVPPHFDEGNASGPLGTNGAAAAPSAPSAAELPPVSKSPSTEATPAPPVRVGVPSQRPAATPPAPAGGLNWVFGLLGTVTGLASFVWPLVCLTVLASLALSAVGLSRFNRLRHRGANGRAIAAVALVIGLTSAANLIFGISQMFQMGSSVGKLLP